MANTGLVSDSQVPSGLRREFIRFAVAGISILVVLSIVAVFLTLLAIRQDAIQRAEQSTQLITDTLIEPLLESDIGQRDSQAWRKLDDLVRNQVLGETIKTVRIWDRNGQVLYSDDPNLVGEQFRLGGHARQVLLEGGSYAEVTDLSRPENALDSREASLVEVYLSVTGRDGRRYLVETYQGESSLSADITRLAVPLILVTAGSLVILALVLVGLGFRMARRFEVDRRQREVLLQRALDASDLERRRIAADLHDGVVQDLVGVSLSMSGLAANARGVPQNAEIALKLDQASARLRQSIKGVRTLLVDIYPPNLSKTGLSAALTDLVDQLPDSMTGTVAFPEPLSLSERSKLTCYRVAREALQNAARHSHATKITVSLEASGDHVVLQIRDNGVGFDTRAQRQGHIGLSLLHHLAEESDGALEVESMPGHGTTLTFRCPLEMA